MARRSFLISSPPPDSSLKSRRQPPPPPPPRLVRRLARDPASPRGDGEDRDMRLRRWADPELMMLIFRWRLPTHERCRVSNSKMKSEDEPPLFQQEPSSLYIRLDALLSGRGFLRGWGVHGARSSDCRRHLADSPHKRRERVVRFFGALPSNLSASDFDRLLPLWVLSRQNNLRLEELI
jgi:hypothetical protein